MYIRCKEGIKINNPEIVAQVFRDILKSEDETDQQKEHFWVMGLNVKNVVTYIELVSLGILTESIVHPREVFKSAILKTACNLIFCHNHPSGDSEPSERDLDITKRLKEGADLLGLKVLDHIIINGKNDITFSFQEEKLL